jgi:hypothetical protein
MSKEILTQARLKDLLDYNQDTGIFTYRKKISDKIVVGAIAGTTNDQGYRIIMINYQRYRSHRLAWLYLYGNFPNGEIDHINGIPSDNRASNLREATRAQQSFNTKPHKNTATGYKGVSKNGKGFSAEAKIGKARHRLGTYKTALDAAIAYKNFTEIAHGQFFKETLNL